MNQAKELIDLIGNTPIIQVKRLDTGKCNLFLKLENTILDTQLKIVLLLILLIMLKKMAY
jgi:cystathionine beta-synthase